MDFKVLLHSGRVVPFLEGLPDPQERKCREALRRLGEDPFRSRSGIDIRKLEVGRETAWRLRVGEYRFVYRIDEKAREVKVTDAFPRKRGYRL
jgi:mRNA-degrading endonuclease RelE of RelBE toxin-antitoxin system